MVLNNLNTISEDTILWPLNSISGRIRKGYLCGKRVMMPTFVSVLLKFTTRSYHLPRSS